MNRFALLNEPASEDEWGSSPFPVSAPVPPLVEEDNRKYPEPSKGEGWKTANKKKVQPKKPTREKSLYPLIQRWSDDFMKQNIENPGYKLLDHINWVAMSKHFQMNPESIGDSKFIRIFDGQIDRSAFNDIFFNLFQKSFGFYYKKWHHSDLSDKKQQFFLYRRNFDDLILLVIPYDLPKIEKFDDLSNFIAEQFKTGARECTMLDFRQFLEENDEKLLQEYCQKIRALN